MKNEESAGQKPSSSQPSERPLSLLELLGVLIQTMQAQTEAITRLAKSNEALVEAMAQAEEDIDDDGPKTYMDGTPIR